MADAGSRRVVAYAPFATFLSAIEYLERDYDVPHRLDWLDASVWHTYSVAIRSQLMGACRFLGFVDEGGKTTAAFKAFLRDKPNRNILMRKILESSYPSILALDLTKASPRQLDGAMRGFGMTGATHKKAVSFFLKAAKFAELPMSPLLLRRVREGGPRRRGRLEVEPASEEVPFASVSQRTSRKVDLRNGGSVTLSVDGSFLDMGTQDRLFVSGLIDSLQEYEKNNKKRP